MEIIHKVLSENLLKECDKVFNQIAYERVWISSDAYWEKQLTRNISGIVTITDAPIDLKEKILNQIGRYLPACNEVIVTYMIWHKHSGLCLHNDANNIFGATIYLTPNWDPEWGGNFIWLKDNNKEDPQILFPKRNTMVLNTKYEYHMVSEVSPYAKTTRVSLQIWGK